MSDSNQSAVIDVGPGGEVGPPSGLVNVGHAIYACYAVGFFIGVTWLVGLVIAYPLWIVTWLWALYRVIKGWIKLNDGKPVS
jgi:uncharacterized membrane protein